MKFSNDMHPALAGMPVPEGLARTNGDYAALYAACCHVRLGGEDGDDDARKFTVPRFRLGLHANLFEDDAGAIESDWFMYRDHVVELNLRLAPHPDSGQWVPAITFTVDGVELYPEGPMLGISGRVVGFITETVLQALSDPHHVWHESTAQRALAWTLDGLITLKGQIDSLDL